MIKNHTEMQKPRAVAQIAFERKMKTSAKKEPIMKISNGKPISLATFAAKKMLDSQRLMLQGSGTNYPAKQLFKGDQKPKRTHQRINSTHTTIKKTRRPMKPYFQDNNTAGGSNTARLGGH